MNIDKPWGWEQVIWIGPHYAVKQLFMRKGCRCSLQYHEKKTETIFVLSGELQIYYEDKERGETSEKVYLAGEFVTIPPRVIHRMTGISDAEYLEASTPELDDVVRLSDDYQRH